MQGIEDGWTAKAAMNIVPNIKMCRFIRKRAKKYPKRQRGTLLPLLLGYHFTIFTVLLVFMAP